jgi:hypothetical protein
VARFSDLLGGGKDPEDESRSTPNPDRPAARETPEDILDRLANYASQAHPDEHDEPAEADAGPEHDEPAEPDVMPEPAHDDALADTIAHAYGRDEVPAPPRHAVLESLPPIDDDLLPRKRPS